MAASYSLLHVCLVPIEILHTYIRSLCLYLHKDASFNWQIEQNMSFEDKTVPPSFVQNKLTSLAKIDEKLESVPKIGMGYIEPLTEGI